MNHRRIRNIFAALAVPGVLGVGAALDAPAQATILCGYDWCFGR